MTSHRKTASAKPVTQPVTNPTPPISYSSASTTGVYRTPKWEVRQGGRDHEKYRSRGF